MTDTKPIRRIAIIGTGVIGASWTALFLAKGLQVIATDIAPNAEAALRKFVEAAWPALKRLGLSPGASQSNLKFTADLALALAGADLVQENGPERIDFKQKLYGQLDELLPPDVIIASSSSGLTMSEIQSGAPSHPERCVIAHPFNPPHLIPLVEIVGGAKTSEATIRRADILHVDRAADGAPQQGNAGPRRQPPPGGVGARGLLPRCRGRRERRRCRHRPVLGPGRALGRHGQHDAQPSRRRSGRHRALLPAVHRPDDDLVEDPRLAGADSRSAKEAHRQRPCRGRITYHRGFGGRARRILLGLIELRTKVQVQAAACCSAARASSCSSSRRRESGASAMPSTAWPCSRPTRASVSPWATRRPRS